MLAFVRARLWAGSGFMVLLAVLGMATGIMRSFTPAAKAGGCAEISRWKFDEGSGITVDDSIGDDDGSITMGNTWRTSGCASLSSTNAACLNFEGSGAGASIVTSSPFPDDDYTFSVWVYADETPQGGDDNWATEPSGSGCTDYGDKYTIAEWGDDDPLLYVNDLGYPVVYPGAVSASIMSHDAWHHLAYTWNGTTGNLYMDGDPIATSLSAGTAGGSILHFGFGTCDTGWQGRMDDARLYGSALSSSQIEELSQGDEPTGCSGGGGGGTPSCGNGVTESGEDCDDGNSSNTDACTNACVTAVCGDGYVRTGVEDCDDQNSATTDSCISCVSARCGDGYIRSGVEQCDGGGSCSAGCQIVTGGGGGGGGGNSSSIKTSKSSSVSINTCTIIEKVVNGKKTYSFVCPPSSSSSSSVKGMVHCCDLRTGNYLGYHTTKECLAMPNIHLGMYGKMPTPPTCKKILFCDFADANCYLPYDAADANKCTTYAKSVLHLAAWQTPPQVLDKGPFATRPFVCGAAANVSSASTSPLVIPKLF
jgi:cysteine-rich repeat protein